MPISLTCDCGKKLTVKDELVGKRVRCPGCQATLTVSAKGPAAAAAKPKAAIGAPQKNGAAPARAPAPPPPPPVDEEDDQQEEDLEDKPVRPPAEEDEDELPSKKKPAYDEDEENLGDDEDLPSKNKKADDEQEEEPGDDEDLPRKKKPAEEDEEKDSDLGEDEDEGESPKKKKKPALDDEEEEEEPVARKKPSRKGEEEEEDEERPRGKKDAKGAEKAAKDEDEESEEEDEDDRPKKGKGKDKEKGKGKSKSEAPPPMLKYVKYIVKGKAKGGKKTFEILDADSSEIVATGKNATGFLSGLVGSIIYEIKDETTGERAFTVGRAGWPFKKDQVADRRGKVVGRFKSKILSLSGGFHVYDEKGKHVCEIKGKLLKSEYKFLTPDGDEMGSVSKTWGGAFKSLLSGAGTYGVQIEEEFQDDNKIKMIMLAATVAVETIFQKAKAGKAKDDDGDDE